MTGTSIAAPHVTGAVALYTPVNGLAVDSAGVAAMRQVLTDPTRGYSIAQADPRGFTGDRDTTPEPFAVPGLA